MTLMDTIRKFSENKKINSEKFKELEDDHRMQKKLLDKQKSSDERFIEDFHKEQREKRIKIEADKIRKIRTKANWKDKSILTGGTSMLHTDKNILKDDRSILKQKNIFTNQMGSLGQGGSFFK